MEIPFEIFRPTTDVCVCTSDRKVFPSTMQQKKAVWLHATNFALNTVLYDGLSDAEYHQPVNISKLNT